MSGPSTGAEILQAEDGLQNDRRESRRGFRAGRRPDSAEKTRGVRAPTRGDEETPLDPPVRTRS